MRIPLTPEEGRSPAQRAAAAAIAAGPRGRVGGPFLALLEHPGLCDLIQQLGGFLRYEGFLGARERELVTLIVARHWAAEYEWHAHAPLAAAAGLEPHVIEAIRLGERPELFQPDAAIYDFCTELLEKRSVSSERHHCLTRAIGVPAMIEVTTLCGYYGLIAMILDIAGIAPLAGALAFNSKNLLSGSSS